MQIWEGGGVKCRLKLFRKFIRIGRKSKVLGDPLPPLSLPLCWRQLMNELCLSLLLLAQPNNAGRHHPFQSLSYRRHPFDFPFPQCNKAHPCHLCHKNPCHTALLITIITPYPPTKPNSIIGMPSAPVQLKGCRVYIFSSASK